MIDLHLHLLPNVDDGAESLSESRAMLSTFVSMGFDRLVVTPHLMEPLSDEYYQQVLAAMSEVSPVAADVGVSLGLGFEHLLTPRLASRLDSGEPSTMAGSKAVLVELPFVAWPADTAHSLYTLRSAGYQPILAHPERYMEAFANPRLVLDSADHGAVLQLTTGSLIGLYGQDSQELSRLLLQACIDGNYPLILSSDAHSNGRRLTSVANGLAWILENVEAGEQLIEWAALRIPEALVSNQKPLSFRDWMAQNHPTIALSQPVSFEDLLAAQATKSTSHRRGFGRLFRG